MVGRMARDIDEKKKRKALRKLRKAAERADANGTELSDWEKQFIEEVEERVETFGSAFSDLEKGSADEPLSMLQQVKLKEIDKKSRGKGGFKRSRFYKSKKAPIRSPRSRDIHEDIEEDTPQKDPRATPKLVGVKSSKQDVAKSAPAATPSRRPAFRVIEGGKE